MKEYWNNLSLREKQVAAGGSVIIAFLLIYLFFFSPLDNKIDALRKHIKNNQALLFWMKETDKRLALVEKNPQQIKKNTGSLLSIVQQEITHTSFITKTPEIHQVENNSVQFTLQKVDFDKLVAWLTQLSQQQGLIVTQITVTPSDQPGIVTSDLIIHGES